MHAGHLKLIGKLSVEFLLVIIDFLLGVTVEALRANIARNWAFSTEVGHFGKKKSGRPHQPFVYD